MDINSDLLAVQARIAEITGSAPQPATADSGPDFAALVQAELRSHGIDSAAPPSQPDPLATARAPVPSDEIERLVSANAATWNVDPSLIKAIIANESGFDANATSGAGAQGLMQLMPATQALYGVCDPFDPAANIDGGTRYLHDLLVRYHHDIQLALAAYNAGPGAVAFYHGVPPFAETRSYVARVSAELRTF